MSVMNKNEIEQRIGALKATGVSNGAERTDGLWIILHENARAKKSYSDAIPLRKLLGNGDGAVSEESMKQHFGNYWRGKFTKQNDIGNGFINRTMKGCVFVSVDDGTARNDFPNSANIIKRGDTEVGAVHHFIERVVTSSKEDGVSEDAGAEAVDEDVVDMEENDVTIGGMDGKMLRNVFNHFPLHDIRSTLACVNSKWRETALDATPSPDDYLTTLEEDRIPCAIEFRGSEQKKDLNSIFTLVRQNTNLQNAISDVRIQQRVAEAQKEVVDDPTIENCSRLFNCALDGYEATGKQVPAKLQHIARRILLITQQQQLSEQTNVDDNEEEQPRRRQQQQQGVFSLKYFDNANKTKTIQLQVKTTTRSCKPTASARSKQEQTRRITTAVEDTITERLGVNNSDENRLKVLQQIAKNNGLTYFDSSKMVFSFDECFTLLHKANLSINQLCIVASFIRLMRPVLKGALWPNRLKKGLCDLIGEGNLEFIVKQLPLIVSKKEDKWSNKPFWYMTRPAELAQRLLERTILDGSFEESIEFSFLLNCIVVVWGIDKADRDTAASLRVANRRGGNSSRHTQLIAAAEDAAECYTNIMQTFMSPKYPLRGGYDWWRKDHSLSISSTFVKDPITSDDVDWDEPHDNLPHTVSYCDGDVLRLCLIQTDEVITGIQVSNSNNEHVVNIEFMIPIFLESLSDTDLRTIKISIYQILGVPSNDYKLNLSLTGICSASAKNPCVCCMAGSDKFNHLSEALHRHRNPASDPPHKDAPLREGTNSTKACHDRIMAATGGGCLPIPENSKREITSANGSCFHAPGIDIPPIKLAHGEVLHIGGGIINHFNSAIFAFLRTIDSNSDWFLKAKSILSTVTTQLEEELSLSKTGPSSSQYCKDILESQRLLREERACRVRAKELREQLEKRSNEEESVDQVALAAVESAEAQAMEALNAVLKHATEDTDLAHQIKLRKGNTELKKLLEKYIKGSSKKPFGPGEYCFKAGLSVCGANFLTQHGGSDLTTDNGMDVMERFDEIATYADQAYPEESEECKKIREFLELCRLLAKEIAELLSFMKSQKKCNATDFLDKLDKFLKRWDAALPDKEYFLKLHHLIHHVVEFIKRYGMCGRVSAESFEAIHALIAKLKSMSRSQSTLNRIKTTNGKLQTVMKPEVMSATETYTERSTGKKRGTYNSKPSTYSTEAAESFEAYDIETYGGVEYIKVFAGEGVILKDHEDIWRMLSTSYIPPKWGEHFQSSQTIPQEKKRRISSGADLNLN